MTDARMITPASTEWPHRLNDLADSPEQLWVRGDLGLLDRPVAIVGARASTEYGHLVARDIARGVFRGGYTVISGGAYGIDAAAHQAALGEQHGTTVIVSAAGIDRAYPKANQHLFDMAQLLISEYEPGTVPSRDRFLARNRIIAALSLGVVVIESAIRSGSLNTARHARELGRPVMAVPGPVTSAVSAGCHHLIRSGNAVLVTDAADVLALLNPKEDS